jgi:ketosteroid isomerase-like protein
MNQNFQKEKNLVLDYYKALDKAEGDEISKVLSSHISKDYIWRGFHPFNEQTDAEELSKVFWQPFRHAFKNMQRRMDIFIAGKNQIDGFESVWVVSMGHLMGLFDNEWLGIQPSRKMAFLRYCEFNKVQDGKITETAMFFDIPHVMIQVGLTPFPPQTGRILFSQDQ